MKVIDLYQRIADGEEVPKHIRVGDSKYYFDCSDSDYYNVIENAPSLLERVWRHNAYVWLNLEVEIIEEEKEIEEITIRDNTLGFPNGEWTSRNMDKAFAYKINELVREVKKLKKNKE